MDIATQVISLKSAWKLRELGIKIDSYISYILPEYTYFLTGVTENDCYFRTSDELHRQAGEYNSIEQERILHAYTSTELGEMLPKEYIPVKNFVSDAVLGCNEYKWEFKLPKGAWISCEKEAEARVKVLIYLLGSGLVTADEINKISKNV